MSSEWGLETRQIHHGQEADPVSGSRAAPIHQIVNTTQIVLEARLQTLEAGFTASR
ncbi:MAG: hypothetical protein P8J19_05520 [Acidimicrobiales bacterium]|nr:hypothetical protein [Acidimicrobiales bacterium]